MGVAERLAEKMIIDGDAKLKYSQKEAEAIKAIVDAKILRNLLLV